MDVTLTVRQGVQAETVRLSIDGRTYTMDQIAALIVAGDLLAASVQAYFNTRGALYADRKGNEEIANMAEALANYGYAEARGAESRDAHVK